MTTLSTLQVSEISGATLRQLQFWDEQALVCPTLNGHSRTYSPEEAIRICIIAEFRRKQVSLQNVRRILMRLPPLKPASMIIWDGQTAWFGEPGDVLRFLCQARCGCYLVSLKEIFERVEKCG